MEESSHLIDRFLFWDAVVVALLVIYDMLLYPKERERIKEMVGKWWIRVDDMAFTAYASEDAERFLLRLNRRFQKGCGLAQLGRGYIGLLLLTEAGVIIYVGAVYLLFQDSLELLFSGQAELAVIGAILINILTDAVALAVSLVLFYWMTLARNWLFLVALMIVDLAFALLAFEYSIVGTVETYVGLKGLFSNRVTYWPPDLTTTLYLLNTAYEVDFKAWLALILLGANSCVATVMHLALVGIFLLSKISRPIIKPVLSRTLYAFHEKGTISVLAAALGSGAKLVQMAVKAYL